MITYREQQLATIANTGKGGKTCGHCRWWEWVDSWHGRCDRVQQSRMPFLQAIRVFGLVKADVAAYHIADECWLSTECDFGCNLFVERMDK